jgi:uncharacterized membrane protein
MIFIDVPWATYVVAVLLPVLVALVTAKGAAKSWGAWLLALFAALTALITEAVNHAADGFSYSAAALIFVTTFTISVATHFGFWKPAGVTGDAGAVRTTIPGGFGSDTAIGG